MAGLRHAAVVCSLLLMVALCACCPGGAEATPTPAAVSLAPDEYCGVVLEPEGDETCVAIGEVLARDSTYYMFYGRRTAAEDYHPYYATSGDGLSWAKQGRLFDPPAGCRMAFPDCILTEGSTYYMYYHCRTATGEDGDPGSWPVYMRESTDLRTWANETCVLDGSLLSNPLTNPSVVKDGAHYYMFVSERTGPGVYRIRLLRSAGRPGGYLDQGIVIDPANPDHSWYSETAYDPTVVPDRIDGRWAVLFAGGGVLGGSIYHYGFASSGALEGTWTVDEHPFYTAPGDDCFGGRGAVLLEDGGVNVYVDRIPGCISGTRIELLRD